MYTCISEGFFQRWRVLNSGSYSIIANRIWHGSDAPQTTVIAESQFVFNFTLVSKYSNFTSMLVTVASEAHRNILIQCTGPSSSSTLSVEIAGVATH